MLADHDRILRAAIAEGDGEIVDTQGDAVFAAFSDALRAVRAAVAAQRSFRDSAASGRESVRVRMGLHTGTPEVSGDRYLGLDVHLAARICAAVHGGQTVVSEAMCERVKDHESGFAIRALGKHYLKDFDAPQSLFQIDPDGQTVEFPPLRSSGSSGDVGRFAGREEELAGAAVEAVARAARRSERRRLSVVFAALGAVVTTVALFLATRPHSTRVAADSVAVIDEKTGEVVSDVGVGPAATRIVPGSGAVWVLDTSNDTLTRINPASHRAVSQGIGLAGQPTDIAVSDGKVWVVDGFDRTATVLNALKGSLIQKVPLRGHLGLGLGDAYAATGAGSVWIANGGFAGISRYNRSNRLVATVPGSSGQIAYGDGSLWVVASYGLFGGSGEIVRINPRTNQPTAHIRVGETDGIAVGAGGTWIVDASTNTVRRIDPTTN
ncbi:MAG: hypothetical protein ACRDQZ_24960, partial [Mycobacteriales bacterium]